MDEIVKKIRQIPDCELSLGHDLTSFTTFKLASKGDLIEVKSIPGLRNLLKLLTEVKKGYLVIGWGANQILPSDCEDFIIL